MIAKRSNKSGNGLHQSGVPASRFWTREVRLLDPRLCRDLIQTRQKQMIDMYDEVWEGVYVVSPIANNAHQELVLTFAMILSVVILQEGRGRVYPGANVSSRRKRWEKSFRCPDVLAVLNGSCAVDCGSHWFGGPDFLVEIHSPGDETPEKVPFYGKIKVRELLLVHRDRRSLQLYRHDGKRLRPVGESNAKNSDWIKSEVVPLVFRFKQTKAGPKTEVKRTDGKRGRWVF